MSCVCRFLRLVRCSVHRVDTREVTVCPGGLREDSTPKPADTLRQVAAAAAVAKHRLGTRHRTVVLRATRRQNADRHADQGHASEWSIVHMVLHGDSINSVELCLSHIGYWAFEFQRESWLTPTYTVSQKLEPTYDFGITLQNKPVLNIFWQRRS